MRTRRTNGTNTYEYVYNGSQLMRMVRNGVVVDFSYINGIPATISYDGMTFYYVVNGQGDITGITDSSGNVQVRYYYDAWGVSTSVYSDDATYGLSLATINPLRYRGNVYDWEVGLYYLESRYYIPEIGRFLNADAFTSTGQGILGNNMFAYCGNNPICRADSSGYFFFDTFKRKIKKMWSAIVEIIEKDEPADYISDQDAEGIGDRRLGVSTVSHGGCGVVATYNALVTLGESPSFSSVLSYYNQRGKTVAWGLAGILPETVASYFSKRGYRVIATDNIDGIDVYSKTADASILWYVYPGTPVFNAHFVHYHRTGAGYTGYNTSENGGIHYFKWASDYGYKEERYYAIGIFIYKQ